MEEQKDLLENIDSQLVFALFFKELGPNFNNVLRKTIHEVIVNLHLLDEDVTIDTHLPSDIINLNKLYHILGDDVIFKNKKVN